MKRYSFFSALILISVISTGCMSSYYGSYAREKGEIVDTLLPPLMTLDDVIAMTKDSVSDEVIISQIGATDSYFLLIAEEIIALKKAGVSENVMKAMIKTSESATTSRTERYSGYPFCWYPYYFYSSPWYSTFYFGLYGGHYNYFPSVYRTPSYSGSHNRGYFGGHGSRGHSSSDHRSFERHR